MTKVTYQTVSKIQIYKKISLAQNSQVILKIFTTPYHPIPLLVASLSNGIICPNNLNGSRRQLQILQSVADITEFITKDGFKEIKKIVESSLYCVLRMLKQILVFFKYNQTQTSK